MPDNTLNGRDRIHLWHPFTPLMYAPDNIVISRGAGSWFYDINDNAYLDAISSWWVNIHGHCNAYITQAIVKQLQQLEHSIFAAFTHEPGIVLAEKLLGHLPSFDKVFLSDNGSTAVEVGLKMALQYWWNKGERKSKIVAFKEGYHGDTFGGMSVAARNAFNKPFEHHLFDVIHLALPTEENIDELCFTLGQHLKSGDIACFIFEPLVLGAGGMLMYQPHLLDRLIALCKQYNCLTIADEVMTGFGRTGTFFATHQLAHKPDIISLSKGITGGFFPLGATVCTKEIHDAFIDSDKTKTFFHGHSYTGNPVTCAAAIASLELMELPETMQKINWIAKQHLDFAKTLTENHKISNVRTTGTILAFDINNDETTGYLNSSSEMLASFFLKRNIILRPLGNVLYILPPYCFTPDELHQVYNAINELLAM